MHSVPCHCLQAGITDGKLKLHKVPLAHYLPGGKLPNNRYCAQVSAARKDIHHIATACQQYSSAHNVCKGTAHRKVAGDQESDFRGRVGRQISDGHIQRARLLGFRVQDEPHDAEGHVDAQVADHLGLQGLDLQALCSACALQTRSMVWSVADHTLSPRVQTKPCMRLMPSERHAGFVRQRFVVHGRQPERPHVVEDEHAERHWRRCREATKRGYLALQGSTGLSGKRRNGACGRLTSAFAQLCCSSKARTQRLRHGGLSHAHQDNAKRL